MEQNKPSKQEEKTQQENKTEDEPIKTFSLGDEFHPVNPDDEVIEYIGERIKALENLEKCTYLIKIII